MVYTYTLKLILPSQELLEKKVLMNTEGVGVNVFSIPGTSIDEYSEIILLEDGKVYHVKAETISRKDEVEEEIIIEEVSEEEVKEWMEDAETSDIKELFDYEYGKELREFIFDLLAL